MDFDNVLDSKMNGFAVAYIVYGGVSLNYNGLNEKQKALFILAMDEAGKQGSNNEMYLKHVHETILKYPRYIVVVSIDGEIVYDAPIVNLLTTMDNVLSKIKGDLFLFSDKDIQLLSECIFKDSFRNNESYSKALSKVSKRVKSIESTMSSNMAGMFKDFEILLSFMRANIDTGEEILHPALMFTESDERLAVSTRTKALLLQNFTRNI